MPNFRRYCRRRFSAAIQSEGTQMAEGSIKKLTDKGFGFIKTESGGKDLFFHMSSLVDVQFDDLHEGQRVTYTEGQGPKGPCAENVRVA
jgi:CspA family cold shock protein